MEKNLRNIIFPILENFIYIQNDGFEYNLKFINFNIEKIKSKKYHFSNS